MDTGLISNALIIGAVSAAVYHTEEGLRALRIDGEGKFADCSRQAGLLLDCPAEKRLLASGSLQEIKQCLGVWSRRQQLLQQLIGGMDRALREETRQLGLELAEQGLANADAAHFARARLLACPPSVDADLDNAIRLSAGFRHCQRLYEELAAVKDHIAPIAQALQELVYFDFPLAVPPDQLYRTLVDRGVVAEAIALSVNAGSRTLNDLVFEFRSDTELEHSCPRWAHLITKFVNRLQALFPKAVKVPAKKMTQQRLNTASDPLIEVVKQFVARHRQKRNQRPSKRNPADQALEAVDKQKAFIRQCIDKGRLSEAEVALMDLVRNQARDSLPKHLCKSLCDLGAQFTERGYFDLAFRVYTAARQANPRDAVCYTGYAETLREVGRPEEALGVYAEAKVRFANNAVCYTGYAETLRELGRPEEALGAYAEAKERFANDVVCWNGYAETLREVGRPEETLGVYAEAKERFANNAVCYTGYAETLRELGRPEEALGAYAEAKERFADDAVCYTGYAETLRELRRPDEALGAYAEAKERFANNAFCYTGYAETLRELGRPEEALGAYAEAKERFANNAVCWNGYAETLREVRRPEEALGVYAEAKERFANNAVCYTGYAETLRELGRPEEALGAYAEVKERFANNAFCYTGYAETLREVGRPEEALGVYAEAKERFANNAVCYTGYAETLRELGQLDAAVAAYRAILSRYPHDGAAPNALACLSVERGEYEEAERLLTVERPRSLQNWRDFHVLAMAKLAQGLYEQSRAMLEWGLAQTPFARQRRVFQTSLAMLALQRREPDIAEENLEVSNAQIIQFPLRAVLRAHAVAAQYRTDEAHGLLEQVKGYKSYGEVVELADVLARRYGLGRVQETAPELDFEIERRELALALRAA